MNPAILKWAVAGSVGLMLCGMSLPAQTSGDARSRPPDSILLTLEGKVEVARTGSSTWTPGRTNQTLQIGDRLRTGIRSRATVRLSNLSVLRVNELTTLQIQPPSAPGKPSLLDLKSGAAYFLSRERPTETEFRTPLASGAIRGTEFHLAVAENGRSVVTLIDGGIALSNEHGVVEMSAGEEATVEPGRAPTKTAALYVMNTIQWCLYYPAVLDVEEIGLSESERTTLAESIAAYRSGDLLAALELFPANPASSSDPVGVYYAALLLAVGQVGEAQYRLGSAPGAGALQSLINTVNQTISNPLSPQTASEWLAESYRLQSRLELDAARSAARAATEQSPGFGFAWARLAELEFSFGRVPEALAALERALQLAPRNAQAVALKGFLLAARNKIPAAREQFEHAIALDGALGHAWLGRGLVRIRSGDAVGGREDLQVAAALEPQRALLRSYLGKAFANANDAERALKELDLAKKLDPNDPTAWLYSALLKQQENEVNDAVRDLEKSKELNDNRRLYRSQLLLDQDRAVRSANLAQVYRDAAMEDWSVREAGRALSADYANYSAHLFLAESYDALRDPRQINLRYETSWFSELLVSQLLAPVGAGNLSQYVSQQEYSKLFARDGLGLSSSTEYQSSGDWLERASQFGTFGDTGYALDFEYRLQNGQRGNNDLEQKTFYGKLKHQLTSQDSLFFGLLYDERAFGDVAQYYNHDGTLAGARAPSPTFRAEEEQSPNLFFGYHREWSPGSHTLFLTGWLDDTLAYEDPNARILFYRYGTLNRQPFSIAALPFVIDYEREFEAFTAELQHIQQVVRHTIVAGARYQTGWAGTRSQVDYPFNMPSLISMQDFDTELQRLSIYAYDQWQLLDTLLLSAGVTYDWLSFPDDIDTSPITNTESEMQRWSPKAGIIWSPLADTHLRAAYTRSLGGVFYDTSVRLEPTQIAGFNQALRSVIPESAVGLVPGTVFETWGLALDQAFKHTGTYLTLQAELLSSEATRTLGIVTNRSIGVPSDAASTRQSLDFEERTVSVTLNQLLGRQWSLGARYRVSDADLDGRFIDVPANVIGLASVNQNEAATLHQLTLFGSFTHRCGFFARGDAVWSQQSNRGYAPRLPGDDFWQFNLYAGYRFPHRKAELRLGLLNISDEDYRLNPLNLYSDLPRERTLSMLFKFYF